MQATKEKLERRTPPAGDDRRSNADRKKKPRKIEPVEGSQTGSEGLGYLKEPGVKPGSTVETFAAAGIPLFV
ncbi:MAG: hypothetical protein J0H60_23795, partial [Rhizobiales bacterium]|nr:hypothetical protein [Hyphomicrobiales bacterium]